MVQDRRDPITASLVEGLQAFIPWKRREFSSSPVTSPELDAIHVVAVITKVPMPGRFVKKNWSRIWNFTFAVSIGFELKKAGMCLAAEPAREPSRHARSLVVSFVD
jgi:hypothetical protein